MRLLTDFPMRTLIAIFLIAIPLAAADLPPLNITTVRSLTKPAPCRAEFPKASLRVPDGLRYVTPDKLTEFAEKMKLALAGDEVGCVIPEDVAWYCMLFTIKDDPLSNVEDKAALNKDALMAWQEKFTADHTPRKAGAQRTVKIGNWTHMPTWNAEKKTLTMGLRMTSDTAEGDIINHKIFLYGPEDQIICLQTVAPINSWEKAVGPNGKAIKLAEEATFAPVPESPEESAAMMYYGKLAGGGLVGALVVILLARMTNARRRPATASPLRRPGLPR
jgi:hypothetical protein